jgi:hypothetical protein
VHWSQAELRLQLGWQAEQLEDALADLERDGLAQPAWPLRLAYASGGALPGAIGLELSLLVQGEGVGRSANGSHM